jgi:hypothetical protein
MKPDIYFQGKVNHGILIGLQLEMKMCWANPIDCFPNKASLMDMAAGSRLSEKAAILP